MITHYTSNKQPLAFRVTPFHQNSLLDVVPEWHAKSTNKDELTTNLGFLAPLFHAIDKS
jgi:hypothetical protein